MSMTGLNRYNSTIGKGLTQPQISHTPRTGVNPYKRAGVSLQASASAALALPAPDANRIPFDLEKDYDLSKYS